jgi:hypothetical protein
MEYLTQPRQVPMFTEDILSVLLKFETGDLGLVYYYSASPSLINPELLQKFFDKLCRSSITEAYYFYRKQPDSQRRPLFEILLNTAIANNSSRAARTVELLELPLGKIEEQWLEESLLTGEQRKSKGAADIILMRKLAMGQLRESAEFLQTSRVSKTSLNDISWANVVHGLDRGMGPRNFQNIYETE